MRYCVIDVGTNSVKLLVADCVEGDIHTLFEDSETTRLGQDVSKTGRLLPEAIDRTMLCVQRFLERARDSKAENFQAYTTSAVRDSSNRDEFLQRFRQLAGLDCQVISGEEEARLIFLGATSNPSLRGREVVVFDIGGGSIEFIQGKDGVIDRKVSLDLGAVRMTEAFLESDPPSIDELGVLDEHLRERIRSGLLHAGFRLPISSVQLLGTGGTISCLASMDLELEFPDPARIDGHRFEMRRLIEFREFLGAMPLAARKRIRGLPPSRADIIVAGAAVLVAGVLCLGRDDICLSARNLRHGAILSRGTGDKT